MWEKAGQENGALMGKFLQNSYGWEDDRGLNRIALILLGL